MEEFWHKDYYPDGFNSLIRDSFERWGVYPSGRITGPYYSMYSSMYSNQGGKETMKIKVNRLKLITSLEAKLTELNQKVEEENKGVFDEVPKYVEDANECIEFLKKRIAAYQAAKTAVEIDEVVDKIPQVDKPQSIRTKGGGYSYAQQDAKQLKQLIARLNLSEQVEVECDDNADYLKFL
jgi:hypothetical protein